MMFNESAKSDALDAAADGDMLDDIHVYGPIIATPP